MVASFSVNFLLKYNIRKETVTDPQCILGFHKLSRGLSAAVSWTLLYIHLTVALELEFFPFFFPKKIVLCV